MKSLVILALVVLVSVVSAEESIIRRLKRDVGGLNPVPGGIAARYRNDERQLYVNSVAEQTGASSGTARYYGVPGAGDYYYPYYRPAYGYYGYPGYGYYGGYPYAY